MGDIKISFKPLNGYITLVMFDYKFAMLDLKNGDKSSKGGTEMKLGRNESCHCGSGKKYKNCCLDKEEKPYCDHSKYAKQKTASEQRRADEEIKDIILNETDFGRIVKQVGGNKYYLKELMK